MHVRTQLKFGKLKWWMKDRLESLWQAIVKFRERTQGVIYWFEVILGTKKVQIVLTRRWRTTEGLICRCFLSSACWEGRREAKGQIWKRLKWKCTFQGKLKNRADPIDTLRVYFKVHTEISIYMKVSVFIMQIVIFVIQDCWSTNYLINNET